MTEWINTEIRCPECDYRGTHLCTADSLYCGFCTNLITDAFSA